MSTNPPRTVTLPDGERLPELELPDPITAIRVYGSAAEFPLLPRQRRFTIGSWSDCDIVVASQFVSALHCVLERRGQRIRVHDQNSRNGTFLRGRRETVFDIGPGDTFLVAATGLLALNDEMQLARPMLAEVLGYEEDALVDHVLVFSTEEVPLLVVGPHGAGQGRLVQAIHRASHRRGQALVHAPELPPGRDEQKRLITSARHGTLAVGMAGTAIDDAFLAMALSPAYQVRLVVLAPPASAGMEPFRPDGLLGFHRIEIRPVRDRRSELGRILDHLFLEGRVSLRFADLTAENQRALRAYLWPENLDEMRQAVAWIVEIVRHGSVRQAAAALDTPRTTLQYWMERVGVQLPVVRSGFSLEAGSAPAARGRGRTSH